MPATDALLPPQTQATPAVELGDDAEIAEQKRKKTGGEIAFNRSAYTGVGFGLNELSSLFITDQFMYGKNLLANAPGFLRRAGSWFSKEGFDALSGHLARLFKVKDIIKDGRLIS